MQFQRFLPVELTSVCATSWVDCSVFRRHGSTVGCTRGTSAPAVRRRCRSPPPPSNRPQGKGCWPDASWRSQSTAGGVLEAWLAFLLCENTIAKPYHRKQPLKVHFTLDFLSFFPKGTYFKKNARNVHSSLLVPFVWTLIKRKHCRRVNYCRG